MTGVPDLGRTRARAGPRRPLRVLVAVALVLAGSGCAARPQPTVTVLAAASLTGTFTTLADRFERAHPGVRVRLSFGASSTLAQQVVAGAPADVFAAADPTTMGTVTAAGAAAGPPQVFARNVLTIAVPPGNPRGVRGVADLARPGVAVALCAPQVPCGRAAQAVLAADGVTVRPVTFEQDVKAVLTKVSLGEVDAGLVYRTDVQAARGAVTQVDLAGADRAVNDYPIAVLAGSGQPRLARAFADLVLGSEGRSVLAAAGFGPP